MAWGVKYRTEFTDIHNLDWRVDIEEDAYIGAINTMQSTGSPLSVEYLANSDHILNEPVKGTIAEFSVYSKTNFQYAELYAIEEFYNRVSIYYGDANLYWRGYIMPGSYAEPYDGVAYPVKISASDGLGQLKDIIYKDVEDDYYNGRMLESQIILDILGKIGITTFTEYCNIYEESMDDGEGDSPFDQIKIDVDIFRDMYCYEVLEQILKKYNAIIRQRNGVFNIFRPVELNQITIYGRIFTAATTKSGTSVTAKQLINRTDYSSDIHDVENGVMMVLAPAKKVIIFQNFGNKQSLIKNWQFDGNTYDGSDFDDWTQTASTNAQPVSGNINEKNQGVYLNSYDTSSPYAYYIYQTFGTSLQATSDGCCIEFDYLLNNRTASPVADVLTMAVLRQSTTYYLSLNGNWVASVQGLSINNTANPGSSGWKHFKMEILNGLLLSNTGITIELYASNKADVRISYKDIKFYFYSTEILQQRIGMVGRQRLPTLTEREKHYDKIFTEITENIYTKTNAINGQELKYNVMLGDVTSAEVNIDNILEQFAGALAVSIRDTLTEAAADFVTDHDADYTDIDVTSDEEDIIFTGKETATKVSGDDFTGDTSITNTSGNLDGSVVATQAYVTSVAQIDTITVTGDSGEADVLCGGVTKALVWETSIGLTLQNFVDDYADDYLVAGIILTCTVDELVFTAKKAGVPFTGDTTITNVIPNLNGSVAHTQANVVGQKRIDTITLSGYEGTADIICDAEEQEVDVDETLSPSSDWNTRGGSESKPLLEIIGDEIATLYSRPKQLIQLPIMETADVDNDPHVSLLGNFQDALNIYNDHFRALVANRGTFDVRNRQWQLDLIEIGEGEEVAAEYPAILDDGHHWWYDPKDLAEITKDGSNFVSAWNSKLIADRNLLQAAGSRQPLWKTPGTILFDGIDNYMKATFNWNQPEMIYIIFKQITWILYEVILDGNTYPSGCLQQRATTPNLMISAGAPTAENNNLPLDTWGIIRILFDGASSKLIINATTPTTGNSGATDMDAFIIGSMGSIGGYTNIEVADIICADIADTEENETAIYDFLVSRIPA